MTMILIEVFIWAPNTTRYTPNKSATFNPHIRLISTFISEGAWYNLVDFKPTNKFNIL